MITIVLITMRGTFIRSDHQVGGLLLSSVRTAEIRLTSFPFAFGVVSIPNPVGSGSSAHPTTLNPGMAVVYL